MWSESGGRRITPGSRSTRLMSLSDGTSITGVVSLREALVKRPDVFVQTLTEKLLIYALGRGLTAEDMPTVRKIVRESGQQQYRFTALLQGIVESTPFQMRLKTAAATQELASRQ